MELAQVVEDSSSHPRMLTVRGVSQRYGWGRTKTYELLGQGKLRGAKVGTRLLIFVDSCEALLASLPAAKFGPSAQRRAKRERG